LDGNRLGGIAAVSSGIRLQNVTVAYDRHPAVRHISGAFTPGSLTAVTGPNGAGKSTLLKALVGERALDSGSIDRDGQAPRDFGYLPQAADVDRSFPLTVADAVMLGAWRDLGPFRGVSAAITERAQRALATVGMTGFERRIVGTLSAGQFQRVLFARLLLQDAKVILLDEPFTAIDSRTTHDLVEIVRRWHADGRTVVAVLHDLDQVRAHFPETLLLARDAVAWGATEQSLSAVNLLKARAMAERWDEGAPVCDRERRGAV
jgi:zinc/manganese transport system ATP-binding protein